MTAGLSELAGREGCYTIDFKREFQGGLVLTVEGGVAGQPVTIDAGVGNAFS
jgi:hypothetical protein